MTQNINEIPKIALAGNPNCGKTALFNSITGGRAKVGNYPGVTVERKEGSAVAPSGFKFTFLDLPGTYSLDSRTPDEVITRDVLLGRHSEEKSPDVLVAVADATNLERCLGLVLELRDLGTPLILALNMMDLAHQRGMELDIDVLGRELGIKIIPTVATRGEGISLLLSEVEKLFAATRAQAAREPHQISGKTIPLHWEKPPRTEIRQRFAEIDRILKLSIQRPPSPTLWTDRIDRIVLHPLWGSLLLIAVLGLVFQAIFTWAQFPMDLMRSGIGWFGEWVQHLIPAGPLRSLLVDGIIAGVGSVVVFLPQILLLFAFILFLEDSGYMPRAAFLMDRLMGRVGLHGRAFIPLLSSFACAIPGVMATRTIENRRDRLTTILIAPLMTCSARLPVYSLLIAAFIPNYVVFGFLRLQGLVMFGLYFAGIAIALVVAVVFRFTMFKGAKPPLLMELPTYKWPNFKNILIGLWERSQLFIRRAGTVILTISILLWFLVSYPKPPVGAAVDPTLAPISYSYAGRIGQAIEPLVRPIGFNWKIAVALIPGFAAREVMISSLATVYAVEGKNPGDTVALGKKLSEDWSVATALSLLIWYVLACQCLSTLAVTRRETNSWRWPIFMLVYMTSLAYGGSWLTYHLAKYAGLG
jgi:ferrous iron transport protein B